MLYCAELEDGQRFYGNTADEGVTEAFARQALDHFKVKADRKEPKKHHVKIYRLTTCNGQLRHTFFIGINTYPRRAEMTVEESDRLVNDTLTIVPECFHDIIRTYIYTESDLESRVAKCQDMVDRVELALKALSATSK